MTLPSSGDIGLKAIALEYGDEAPHGLTEFYGKPGLPSSGQLHIADFYGKSADLGELVLQVQARFYNTPKTNSVGADSNKAPYGTRPTIIIGGVEYWLGKILASTCYFTAPGMLFVGPSVNGGVMPPLDAYVDLKFSTNMTDLTRHFATTDTWSDSGPGGIVFKPAAHPTVIATGSFSSCALTLKCN